jgi:ribosomal-protein-alanine N-acetyltransferase
MVAEVADRVVGFMVYQQPERSLDVLNFAVHPRVAPAGYRGRWPSKLIGKLSSHRRTRITLAVRESNLSAQLFFRSQRVPGRRRSCGATTRTASRRTGWCTG